MAEWWTNRSLPPSSGVMNPKPLSLLNHFTVPFMRIVLHPKVAVGVIDQADSLRVQPSPTMQLSLHIEFQGSTTLSVSAKPPSNQWRTGNPACPFSRSRDRQD